MSDLTVPASLDAILDTFRAEPSRTWSLIVTIYGDAVLPRGGSLWLGTLLDILAAYGIGDGVVRTAMSRLAADGWLERTKIGRNSFYRLTEKGRVSFASATERIYHPKPQDWDGRLHLAVLDEGEDGESERWSLEASGFGAISPILMLAPGGRAPPSTDAIIVTATEMDTGQARRLIGRAYPLHLLSRRYRRFLADLGPLALGLATGTTTLSGLDALVVRTLLIHQYRRLLQRDPMLPPALLPADWPGGEAQRSCAAVYHAVLPASEAWLDENGRSEEGPLPPADATLAGRLRGLGALADGALLSPSP